MIQDELFERGLRIRREMFGPQGAEDAADTASGALAGDTADGVSAAGSGEPGDTAGRG